MEVKELKQTCVACPSQWEFKTFQNRMVYVRYRWGRLSIILGEPDGDISNAINGKILFSKRLGEPFDGLIDWKEVENIVKKLPNNCIELIFYKGQ